MSSALLLSWRHPSQREKPRRELSEHRILTREADEDPTV